MGKGIKYLLLTVQLNHIGGVMVSVLATSAIDRGFGPTSGQTKRYNWILVFPKHASLWSKSKDWLARNHDNMSDLSDVSTLGLLFQ